MRVVVFIKQVPAASEMPWDKKTGQLKRGLGEGMMNPACRHALEAALQLKDQTGCDVTAVSMGPSSAEEVLREALALGADRAFLLNDKALAGADAPVTSYTLALSVRAVCPEFAILFLGNQTADSETGQVAPHLAEELGLPAAMNIESLCLEGPKLTVERLMDGRLETLEMEVPALVSVSTRGFAPRDVPLDGVERSFGGGRLVVLTARDLRAERQMVGLAGARGRIRKVYSPMQKARAELITGAPRAAVEKLLTLHGERLSGLVGQDMGGRERRNG